MFSSSALARDLACWVALVPVACVLAGTEMPARAGLGLWLSASGADAAVTDETQAVAEEPATEEETRAIKKQVGWTRVGPLGETPKRVTDDLPLSDQADRGHWVKYEPLWDEFDGAELDAAKWHCGIGAWLGRQPALFWDRNVTASEGKLHLTMRKEEAPNTPHEQG
jgi:hypothetical protein